MRLVWNLQGVSEQVGAGEVDSTVGLRSQYNFE